MYMHEEVILAVLPILEKYRAEGVKIIDLVGEMNHAAWVISSHTDDGLKMLKDSINGSTN